MMGRKRLLDAVAPAVLGCAALLFGCEGEPKEVSASPQTQPAGAPRDEGKIEPLPAKALRPLDKLEPTIEKPKNPDLPDKLPDQARKLLQDAEKQLAQRKYPQAVRLLERASGYDPGNPQVLRLLGKAYLGLPNRGKAITNLAAAAKLAPDDLEAHLLLGQLAAAQKQTPAALLHLRTAMACSAARADSPRAAEALLTLALLLDREGYWTAALDCYSQLDAWIKAHARDYAAMASLRQWVLRPERLQARRGSMLLLLRHHEQAAKLLLRAYHRNRTDPRTAKLLLDALLADKQYDLAETVLLEMADQPAQRANVPEMLATLCRQKRDRELPERFWKACRAKHAVDASLAVALAKTAQQLGWNDQALAILHSILSVSPADADLWRILSRSYGQRNKIDELFAHVVDALAASAEAVEPVASAMPELASSAGEGVERQFAERARKSTSPAKPALLYVAGRLATARGKHLLAADMYRRAIERKDDFVAAYEALLDAYVAQKRQDRIDRLLAHVDRLAKDKHWSKYLRGKIALKRGQPDQAIDALEAALQQKAGDLPTFLLLAKAYAAAGDVSKATGTLRKALTAHPGNADVTRRLFDLYVSRRRLREARVLVGGLLRRDRQSIAGRLMLAELALLSGQRKQAVQILDQLAQRAPDNVAAHLLSVRALIGPTPGIFSKADFDRASKRLGEILRAQPGHRDARKRLAELLGAVGKTAEAAGVWATLFDEAPAEADLARKYTAALMAAKQYETARRAVRRFRQADPKALWARITELGLSAELKDFASVRRLCEQWIGETDDDNTKVLFRQELLRLLLVGEQYDQALQVVEQRLAQKPDQRERDRLTNSKVRLLALAGRYDQAAKLADRLLQADPLSQAGRALIFAAIEAKDHDRALQLIDRQIATDRDLLARLRAVREALAGLAAKEPQAASRYKARVEKLPEPLKPALSEAVDANQHDRAGRLLDAWSKPTEAAIERSRTLRIAVFGETKQLGRARHEAEAWIKADPNALAPRTALVSLLAEAEAYGEADRIVTAWLEADLPTTLPTQPAEISETLRWMLETTARLKVLQRQFAPALALAERHLKLDPKNMDLLTLKSTALTELGRDAEALATMQAAFEIDPNDASINNNLGYMYADRGIQLDQAERMLKRALRARPGETAFTDSLGWIHYKRGRLRDAGRVFQRLVESRTDEEIAHGVILDHAGDVYYRLGWKDRARAFWERAIKLAENEKHPAREDRLLLAAAKAKIKALRDGREPKIAPLGEPAPADVKDKD